MQPQDAVPSAHILGVHAGVSTGQPGEPTAQSQRVCQQVASVHERLGELDEAPGEFTLLRSCAEVCKVTRLLHTVGLGISQET